MGISPVWQRRRLPPIGISKHDRLCPRIRAVIDMSLSQCDRLQVREPVLAPVIDGANLSPVHDLARSSRAAILAMEGTADGDIGQLLSIPRGTFHIPFKHSAS